MVIENVVESLADYVDTYEGVQNLRQHHYETVAAEHDWPSATRVDACARRHGIGVGTDEGPFRTMLELGRRRAQERRREAA